MTEAERDVSIEWVYEHLVCEFDHWDICLAGLVSDGGVYRLARVIDPEADDVQYTLHDIHWTDECNEYLEDYRVAYAHWFHTNGKRETRYGGWDLGWFSDKWQHRNPIEAAGK